MRHLPIGYFIDNKYNIKNENITQEKTNEKNRGEKVLLRFQRRRLILWNK